MFKRERTQSSSKKKIVATQSSNVVSTFLERKMIYTPKIQFTLKEIEIAKINKNDKYNR